MVTVQILFNEICTVTVVAVLYTAELWHKERRTATVLRQRELDLFSDT